MDESTSQTCGDLSVRSFPHIAVADNVHPQGDNGDSVRRHLWHESSVDLSKLLQYYMKLAKIRLTGS